MPKPSTSFAALALVAVLAGVAVVTAMTNSPTVHRETLRDPRPRFSPITENALSALQSELTRRFTTRDNVDFGMSRVVRESARMHIGPVAGEIDSSRTIPYDPKTKTYEIDGKHIAPKDIKPFMTPENPIEQSAVDSFSEENCEVAIYTVGQFDRDKTVPNEYRLAPSSSAFVYYGSDGIRAKGPAYLRQDTSRAPDASEIEGFARKAWATNETDYDADGPDGWHLYAHRIAVSDKSCLGCHGNPTASSGLLRSLRPGVHKVGDPVGLFVIALRPKPIAQTK